MASIDSSFDVDGLVQQRKELDQLLMKNPAMEKKMQKIIRTVLGKVRRALASDAKNAMKSDPRQAYKAVRTAVYRRILGGQVNILNKKKAGAPGSYVPTKTLKSGQRGGNRRVRSPRTRALQGYQGSDRGFILRFLNSGTSDRYINFLPDSSREHVHRGSQGGNVKKYGRTINTGRRGNIASRNWFGQRSHVEMENAAANLERMIDDLIKESIKQ